MSESTTKSKTSDASANNNYKYFEDFARLIFCVSTILGNKQLLNFDEFSNELAK